MTYLNFKMLYYSHLWRGCIFMSVAILLQACEYFCLEKIYANLLVISVTISSYLGSTFHTYKIKKWIQVSEGLQ